MCSAIKAYLAQERPLEAIYIILYLPDKPEQEHKDRNAAFIAEANLVLGVPYNPTLNIRQTREFYGRQEELKGIESVITDTKPDKGKHNVVILGGPRIGKWTLLDQLFERAQKPDSALKQGRHVVKVTFGRVHENTPASFVYRKFLCALHEIEQDEDIKREIKEAYADPEMDCAKFLRFLEDHSNRYPQVVFLVDHLPQLLDMEGEGAEKFKDVRAFWRDIDRLKERVRFVYTARADTQYQQLLDRLSGRFKDGLEVIRLKCVSEEDRESWINGLYQRYLERDATSVEQRFIKQEAGSHPYLIGLACYALIEAIKRDAIMNPEHHPKKYTEGSLERFFRQARQVIEGSRRAFFDQLMEPIDREELVLVELRTLATAVATEEEIDQLRQDLQKEDPDAKRRVQDLRDIMLYQRHYLHQETLRQLEARGYLVSADEAKPVEPATAQFMAKPFWLYVEDYFRTRRRMQEVVQPKDLVITLLKGYQEPVAATEAADAPSKSLGQDAHVIRTMFRSRGARIITAQKPFPPEIRQEFMDSFSQLINNRLHPAKHPDPGVFQDLEEVGNYILTQFTTIEVKRHLQDLPHGSTVLLLVDDALKDIPWELMLETAYAGEIPFRVGRSIVSPRQPSLVRPPVRGPGKIKALLIGNPTDDLTTAKREVEWLAETLQRDERFAEPDVLIGASDCQRIRLLSRLSSSEYGLVHYSGHTRFDGERSAWQLRDGNITTDRLTNALQMAPPVLVFSSSCESAKASKSKVIKYEDQTFDLPSAFLQAGVEAYVGTLWEVYTEPAQGFVQEFYSAFLSAEYNLGECVRRAKWACKQRGRWQERIHWLAFVLYGDPHIRPGDLFPALRKQEE
jgi:hypothetical protein